MRRVQPNKGYGQHFLVDKSVVEKIADTIKKYHQSENLIEIGSGTGALTSALIPHFVDSLTCIEIDERCIDFLHKTYPELQGKIIFEDFLHTDLEPILGNSASVVGNFPYNISSQIIFKILEHKEQIPLMIGMFQKEVAERIASPHGNKSYGILSVLTQLYYDTEVLFDIPPEAFYPKPKVHSSILILKRKETADEVSFSALKTVVKNAFNQRRKMLRNSLKQIAPAETLGEEQFKKRPEQLSVQDFVELTKKIQPQK